MGRSVRLVFTVRGLHGLALVAISSRVRARHRRCAAEFLLLLPKRGVAAAIVSATAVSVLAAWRPQCDVGVR